MSIMEVLLGHAVVILSWVSSLEGFADSAFTKGIRIMREESEKKCDKIAEEPYFTPELVVGKQWRVCYDWHMLLENSCVDMEFQYSTEQIVQRVYTEMWEYLEEQPNWSAATLLATLGRARHEVLLLADQGPEGRFIGVLNVARDVRHVRRQDSVPLMIFQLKFYGNNRFLIMLDCILGTGTLSFWADQPPPTKQEIDDVVKKNKLGVGRHSCIHYEPAQNTTTEITNTTTMAT